MIQRINFNDFVDAFYRAGREYQFSYEGLEKLYALLEELYNGEYELDVIELCTNYKEDEDGNIITVE